jgi:hypothetical protein
VALNGTEKLAHKLIIDVVIGLAWGLIVDLG